MWRSLEAADYYGSSPAWKRLHLTGLLLAVSACCVSSDLPNPGSLTPFSQGAGAHLPLPGGLDGALSGAWFQGHDTQLPATFFIPDARTAQDPESDSVSVDVRRARRSARAQPHVRASSSRFFLTTFPKNVNGVIQSEANYTVVLKCELMNGPQAVLKWTLNGRLCQTGGLLLIRRLTQEHLGSYVCEAKNGMEQFSSAPLNLMLLEGEPINPAGPDPFENYYLTGGPAIGTLVAGILGAVALVVSAGFAAHQWKSFLMS
ncbi:immunoglobulin superfamily member 23 [Sorex fumeus]|uniref:immunoglobulin superfamily member 23 n=1 Tax=Sorex fumeus TaxID=62283 RepID=UPI0024AD1768|nr:immunoglobulin superfamily member 23 [Sorex fumeus]